MSLVQKYKSQAQKLDILYKHELQNFILLIF